MEDLCARSTASLVQSLSCCSEPFAFPERVSSIVVFGSRPEVAQRLRSLLLETHSLATTPLLLVGTKHEVASLLAAAADLHTAHCEVSVAGGSTHANAIWASQKLLELSLLGDPLLLVAFPVLARSAVDALTHFCVPSETIHPAFPASLLAASDASIDRAWVKATCDAATRVTWDGRPDAETCAPENTCPEPKRCSVCFHISRPNATRCTACYSHSTF